MPEFCQFLSLKKSDRKLSNAEIVRSLRFMIAAEYEAIQLYMQMAESIDNEMIKAALKEIANDERVHAGCFMRLLEAVNPEEKSYYAQGAKEMDEKFISSASATDTAIVADEPYDQD